MYIDAKGLIFDDLNNAINKTSDDLSINNCLGQRFIAAGKKNGVITINGTPGNALGAYLDGAKIFVNGNAQDAVGDTMNDGEIIVDGNVGDALGYAMRGGKIYIKGNSGYRTGIHMKQYMDKKPVIIVGGTSGSFLGEYLAGGIIIVLNLNNEDQIVGNFTGTGMHGGKIFLRCPNPPENLTEQVSVSPANENDIEEIANYLLEYRTYFNIKDIDTSSFYVLKPNAKNPYKKLYVAN